MKDLFTRIEALKNYVLIFTSGVYGLGLLCWMYYSWKFNLGHLSALEAQYFITGIFPTITVLYFYWLKFEFPSSRRYVVKFLESHDTSLKIVRIIVPTFQFAVLIGCLIYFYVTPFTMPIRFPYWLNLTLFFVLLNILLLIYPAVLDEYSIVSSLNTIWEDIIYMVLLFFIWYFLDIPCCVDVADFNQLCRRLLSEPSSGTWGR